jgi:Hg(II)-responsive transcriptional regulator
MGARVSIGKIAAEAGVGVQTIRFYERHGLLPKPSRTESGHREYRVEDADRVRFIKKSQALGFTLQEIRDLLRLNQKSSKATCEDVRRRADLKVAEIGAKIRDLEMIRDRLTDVIDACGESRKAVEKCLIFDCFPKGREDV